jgi:hypothetical protein
MVRARHDVDARGVVAQTGERDGAGEARGVHARDL